MTATFTDTLGDPQNASVVYNSDMQFDAPNDVDTAAPVYAFVLAYNTDANQTASWDVTFSQTVPEPGSLALLGLGGLALIRRRRRA